MAVVAVPIADVAGIVAGVAGINADVAGIIADTDSSSGSGWSTISGS